MSPFVPSLAEGAYRVLMVGDSVARTMSWGLEPEFEAHGHSFVGRTFPGCGVSAGFMLDRNGKPFEWSEICFGRVARQVQLALDQVRPDLVTLVPERREEITTEGGLDVAGDAEAVAAAVGETTVSTKLAGLLSTALERE